MKHKSIFFQIYTISDLPIYISAEIVDTYKPGSRPTGNTSLKEVEELKELLISLVSQTETDYKNGLFTKYQEKTTSAGFHLASVEDAFEFNNYHDGLHMGYMMSMRRFV